MPIQPLRFLGSLLFGFLDAYFRIVVRYFSLLVVVEDISSNVVTVGKCHFAERRKSFGFFFFLYYNMSNFVK